MASVIISKRPARLLVPRVRVAQARELAQRFNQTDSNVLINGGKAIMQFDHVEADPIWLLDLRRAGLPYVWFWGADALEWRYSDASKITAGRGHTIFNTGSKTNSADGFKIACGDFMNFEFPLACVTEEATSIFGGSLLIA